MVELQKFCFCLSIRIGTYIIGGLYLMGLLEAIFTSNSIQAFTDASVVIAFVAMLREDESDSRICLFVTYIVQMLIVLVMELVLTVKINVESTHWQTSVCQKSYEEATKGQNLAPMDTPNFAPPEVSLVSLDDQPTGLDAPPDLFEGNVDIS